MGSVAADFVIRKQKILLFLLRFSHTIVLAHAHAQRGLANPRDFSQDQTQVCRESQGLQRLVGEQGVGEPRDSPERAWPEQHACNNLHIRGPSIAQGQQPDGGANPFVK